MRSGGVTCMAVLTTCSISVRPPARCSTLACRDFMRVPSPAARMTTLISGFIVNLRRKPAFAASARELHGDRGGSYRIVAYDGSLREQVRGDHFHAHGFQFHSIVC